ncbi:MAG: phosphatidate cytidylyltransferase [Chitinivibrionales bacterium]|nr:phosphatidate cytidylyltransferase [Chitinivibrionales bacterium]
MRLSNLQKRLLFVIWAIPAAWLLINFNVPLFSLLPHDLYTSLRLSSSNQLYAGHVLATILIFLGCSEYLHLLTKLYPKNGFWIIYLWIGLQVISYFWPNHRLLLMRYDLYILMTIIAAEAFIWGETNSRWKRASLLFSGTSFLIIACFSMFDLYLEPFQSVFSRTFASPFFAQINITIIIASIFFCDSAAYFIGTWIGKHHFSSISPKKTIEGSIAGLCASVLTVSLSWYFLTESKYPLYGGIILGVLIGIFAQIGDLLVSLIKRYFEVKDASNLIPGHGGILDRFDSLFFTAPIINIFVVIFQKIAT